MGYTVGMIRHRPFIHAILVSFALASALAVTGCEILFSSSGGLGSSSLTINAATTPVTKVSFGDSSNCTVTLTGLSNSSVYLVKLNTAGTAVSAGTTGSASNIVASSRDAASGEASPSLNLTDASGDPLSGVFKTSAGTVRRYDHKASQEFSAHPPIKPSSVSSLRSTNARSASASTVALPESGTVGTTTKDFWVDTSSVTAYSYGGTYWKKITTTLQGSSEYASVWVSTDYDSTKTSGTYVITPTAAQKIADTFAYFYPIETNIFGYEYGGGPGGTGGRDGKKPIDIVLYDIGGDSTQVLTSGGVVGYFWAKDWYPTTGSSATDTNFYTYSNYGEIFYIDTIFASAEPGVMYSTLLHEFQHMIDWNVKAVTNNKSPSTWYNEMLSQVAEDMMSSYLTAKLGSEYDVSKDGVIAARIPYYNAGYYLSGLTDWLDGNDVYYSYAGSYAFGAYLARNYGGASFIQSLASNDSVDTASITSALTSLGCSESTFAAAFARYPEALICSSSGNTAATLAKVNTFDRTSTKTVGSYTYTFPAFDGADYSYSSGGTTYYGPGVFTLASDPVIRPYGAFIQSSSSWLKASGSLTITLKKPTDSNISMYLLVRGI